jgi:hypothetical protein
VDSTFKCNWTTLSLQWSEMFIALAHALIFAP